MIDKPTHRWVKTPKMSSRFLSDYMAASEVRKRTIVRDCKYRKIARGIQHGRAKAFIANSLKSGTLSVDSLYEEGNRLLDMMADSDFERDALDVNGDFLIAYSEAFSMDTFPKTAEIPTAPAEIKVDLNGVEVNPDIWSGLQRVNLKNRLRTGLITIRYAKGKPLDEEVGKHQSSILFGIRKFIDGEEENAAEEKLCLTLDCVTGNFISAPTDATRRFQNVQAACASIAERWDSIAPPEKAILSNG